MGQWWYTSTKGRTCNDSLEKGSFTLEGRRDARRHLNAEITQSNATTAKKSLTTKHTNATKQRYVGNALKKAITIANVWRLSGNVFYVEAPMNRLAKTARSSTHLNMSRTLCMIQLNVRKQDAVHDSLMNDKEIQDAMVLAIQ